MGLKLTVGTRSKSPIEEIAQTKSWKVTFSESLKGLVQTDHRFHVVAELQ